MFNMFLDGYDRTAMDEVYGGLLKSRTITVNDVRVESALGDIIPDIVVEKDGRMLIVEIYVTHKVDDAKRNKIKQMGVSAMEIDLHDLYGNEIDEATLRTKISDPDRQKWIYNAQISKYVERRRERFLKKQQLILSLMHKKGTYKKIYWNELASGRAAPVIYCPKYANHSIFWCCFGCTYCCPMIGFEKYVEYRYHPFWIEKDVHQDLVCGYSLRNKPDFDYGAFSCEYNRHSRKSVPNRVNIELIESYDEYID